MNKNEKKQLRKQQELEQWISEQHTCERCGKVMTEKFGCGKYCCKYCAFRGKKVVPVLSKEQFEDYYLIQNLSLSEIASITNLSFNIIYDIKTKYKITKSKEKFKECMTRVGNDPELKQRIRQSNYQKYGVNYPTQLKDTMEKRRKNNMEKYGVRNVMQLNDNKIKMVESRQKNNPNWKQDREIKRNATCMKRYNISNPFQFEHFHSLYCKKYLYDNISFDSSWELSLWIYAKDHNEEITREPLRFKYTTNNGKTHFYTPDFKYKDQLIEVKGPQFLDENLNLINCRTGERDDNLICLQNCMRENNVILFTITEMTPILEYINIQYGPGYLNQFNKNKKR